MVSKSRESTNIVYRVVTSCTSMPILLHMYYVTCWSKTQHILRLHLHLHFH